MYVQDRVYNLFFTILENIQNQLQIQKLFRIFLQFNIVSIESHVLMMYVQNRVHK